jgi:hypothetical protein
VDPSRALGALLLVGLTACGTHTVTVFAPAADVPAQTEVVAAVRPGTVTHFASGAAVDEHGVVRHEGKIVARLAPSDTLVFRVGSEATFGRVQVTRNPKYELISLLGVVVVVGGVIASWAIAGGACPFAGLSSTGCIGTVGLLGTVASLGGGVPLFAWGVHGELLTTTAPPSARRVTVAPSGVTLQF